MDPRILGGAFGGMPLPPLNGIALPLNSQSLAAYQMLVQASQQQQQQQQLLSALSAQATDAATDAATAAASNEDAASSEADDADDEHDNSASQRARGGRKRKSADDKAWTGVQVGKGVPCTVNPLACAFQPCLCTGRMTPYLQNYYVLYFLVAGARQGEIRAAEGRVG